MLDQVILTAIIIWTTNKTPTPCTFKIDYPHACYYEPSNTIYISKEIKGFNKYFVLYHEAGHSLYKENFPRDIFKNTYFDPAYEGLADNFAWWMYAKKYPREQKFVNSVINKEKQDFFTSTCQKKCQADILKLKIK